MKTKIEWGAKEKKQSLSFIEHIFRFIWFIFVRVVYSCNESHYVVVDNFALFIPVWGMLFLLNTCSTSFCWKENFNHPTTTFWFLFRTAVCDGSLGEGAGRGRVL